MPETIIRDAETTEELFKPVSSLSPEDEHIKIRVTGQTPERSYEDRSVFFEVYTTPSPAEPIKLNGTVSWLQAEDAIELGQMLIRQGAFALKANMIQHQLIHMEQRLKQLLQEGRIEALEFTLVDSSPVNHGPGFKEFRLTPAWKLLRAPEFEKDFSFNKVIYFSPFPKEYAKQLEAYTEFCKVKFSNYDHEETIKAFNKECGND
jgi:hypothetical protein